MSEVLDIEVDGEVEHPHGDGLGGRSTPWGLPVAVALVGSLLLAVLVLVVLPALTGTGDGAPVAQKPEGSPPLAPTTEPPASATQTDDPRVAAVRAALAVWGEFVADGDLGHLRPWFVEDGPQYRQLAEEALQLAAKPGEAYTVVTEDESIAMNGEAEAAITATVTWMRAAEGAQEYEWEVVLRRAEDGRWLLWTVRDLEA